MMKSLRFFIMALLCAVANVAWGGEVAYKTLTFSKNTNSQGVSSYSSSWYATIDGFRWDLANFNNNNNQWNYVKCGSKNDAYVATITTNTAIDKAITEVVVTIDAVTVASVNSATLEVASKSTFEDAQTISVTLSQGDVTYTIPNPTENQFYKLKFDCKKSSNGIITISKVVYKSAEGTVNPKVATPTFSPDGGTYTSAQNVTISCATADATIHYTTDGSEPTANSPTYSDAISVSTTTTIKAIAVKNEMTNSSVAEATYTFPNSISEVRAMTDGSQICTRGVVTGSVSGRNYIQDANAAICVYSGQLTVGTEYVVQGTLNTYNGLLQIKDHTESSISTENTIAPEVMTISDILDNCDKSSNKQGWLVKIENAEVTAKASNYTTIKQGDKSINVYGISNVEYDIKDKLTLTGNISYNNNARIECPTDITVTQAPSLTISPESVNVTQDGTNEGSFTITTNVTNFDNVEISFNYYESASVETPTTTLPSWLTLAVSDDHATIDYTVEANDGAARSAYFELVFTSSEFDGGKLVSNMFSISQEKYIDPLAVKTYRLVTDASQLFNDDVILIVNQDAAKAMGGQKTNNRSAVAVIIEDQGQTINLNDANEDVQRITLQRSDNNFYFNVGDDGYLYAASSSNNYLRTEANADDNDNAKATISINNDDGKASVIFQGTNTRNVLRYNSSNSLFACYESASQQPIYIYKQEKDPEQFELTIDSRSTDGKKNYYATISNLGSGNYVVPAGVKLSTITINNKKVVKTQTWEENDVISGNGAYYVVAAGIDDTNALTFNFAPTTNAVTKAPGTNWLHPAIANVPTAAPGEGSYLFYKLTLDANNTQNSVGFYWGGNDGVAFSFKTTQKAYLAISQDSNSAGLSSIEIDDTTGINVIQSNTEQNDEVYTLSGVRVKGNLPKGIYIVNGKKQIVK